MVFSSHLASKPSYGGEREGADDSILSNLFLPFGKVRMGYPTGEARWGLMTIGRVTCSFPWGKVRMGLRLRRDIPLRDGATGRL